MEEFSPMLAAPADRSRVPFVNVGVAGRWLATLLHGVEYFAGLVLAVDIRWKRHVAEPFHLRGYPARVAGGESHGAQAELAARDDLPFEFAFAKYHALARFHLPSGTYQCLP